VAGSSRTRTSKVFQEA